MSQVYRAVGWNRQKRRYDTTILVGLLLYMLLFVGVGAFVDTNFTIETLLIRACGTAAFLLLHIVLAIGPLCRIDRRFLPLLYNRRHLGVTTFVVALVHGTLSVIQFHALGDVNPIVSVLVTSRQYGSLPDFPFQQLGLAALGILFLMAATSHDFWLRALSAPVWKCLHMLIYGAYALVVAHVSLGALQAERSPAYAVLLFAGLTGVMGLHLRAARLERQRDREAIRSPESDGFVDVCAVSEIPETRARAVTLGGERVAVYRYDGRLSAVSGVCRHQNGPLAEGKIVAGCIVCPWHGYEYEPATGCAPPPFTEKLPTFSVRVHDGRVFVHPRPHTPGTRVEPAVEGTRGAA
jgi:nitrite reductase/ring-hydroxylating ferredoxin subunit/DMSO/TMAO reductase YedYZ heme-binding membrane subunit